MRLRALTPSRRSLFIAASLAAALVLSAVPAAAETTPAHTAPAAPVVRIQPAIRPVDRTAGYFVGIAEAAAAAAAGKVDTAALNTQIAQLHASTTMPAPTVSLLITRLRGTTAQVGQALAAYDAEQAAKAAAAERARRAQAARLAAQAQARAAAAAAQARAAAARQAAVNARTAQPAAATAPTPAAPPPAVVSSGDPRALAQQMMSSRYGWAADQFSCLDALWNRESGWRVNAASPSGAYGIPQALPGSKMGPGWQSDASVQIAWGLGYIQSRYGTPCGAWSHSQSAGWY